MKQMIKTISVTVFTISTLGALTACQLPAYQGEARDVKRRPRESGVVAIPRKFRPEDRARAEDTMRTVCAPGSFSVVEEGEIVTWQQVVADSRETNRDNSEHEMGKILGMSVTGGEREGKDTRTSSTSKNLTEWQISYVCAKAEAKSEAKVDERKPKPKRQ